MIKQRLLRNLIFSNRLNKNFADRIRIKKDYYAILGVPKDASETEIKESYRKLAKIYHPDVSLDAKETSQSAADKFRDIAEAYAVLSNKAMRLDYDTRTRNNPDAIYNKEK